MHLDELLPPSPEDLGLRATTAVGWKLLSQGLTTGVQILTGIVLARLLMPTDFGILGMATVVTSLATFGAALAVRWTLEARDVSDPVVLTLTLTAGLGAAVLLTVFSPVPQHRAELHSLLARLRRRQRTPGSQE